MAHVKPPHPGLWSSEVGPHLLCGAEVQKEITVRSDKSRYEKQPPVAQLVPWALGLLKSMVVYLPPSCTLLKVSHSAVLLFLYYSWWVLFQNSSCSLSAEQLCIGLETSHRATGTPGMLLPDSTFNSTNRESYCEKRGWLGYWSYFKIEKKNPNNQQIGYFRVLLEVIFTFLLWFRNKI